MADTTVGLGLDMSDVARALARLPEMTSDEAEKAVRELTRTFDRAARESKKLSREVKKQGEAFKSVEDAAGKAGASSAKLAGILGTISPELAEIARFGNDVGDALEVAAGGGAKVGAALGAVGLAVAAAAAVYASLSGEIERATKTMETHAEVASRVEAAHRSLEAAQVDLAEATGQITAAQAAQQRQAMAVVAGVDALRDSQAQHRKELDASTQSAQAWLDRLGMLMGPVGRLTEWSADQVFGWSDTIEENAKQTRALDQELVATEAILSRTVETQAAATAARSTATKATMAATRAEAALSAAYAESKAAMDEHTAASQQSRGATEQLEAVAQRARESRMDGLALLDAQTAAEVRHAEAILQTAVAQATSDSERLAAVEAFESARFEIQESYAAKAQALMDAETEAALARQAAINEAYSDAAGTIAGSLADGLALAAEAMSESNTEAARAAFALSKAAALGQVAVDTAQAISSVNAAWAAVPPVAAALTAAAVAVGATQAATIASTQPGFHTGGIYSASADQRSISVTSGELAGILSQQGIAAVGGERGVQKANRGESPMPPITIAQVYGHRAFDRLTYDAFGRPGSPLRKATRAGRPKPGRRS